MMKRMMVIMLTIMMLSSCYYADQVFGDIKESMKDILKRPLNKREQMDGLTLIIPANTYINQKGGSIVDIKTGYGLPIGFTSYDGCTEVFYYKKIRGDLYYRLTYNEMIPGVEEIAQKIIRVNGFTKTCNK